MGSRKDRKAGRIVKVANYKRAISIAVNDKMKDLVLNLEEGKEFGETETDAIRQVHSKTVDELIREIPQEKQLILEANDNFVIGFKAEANALSI